MPPKHLTSYQNHISGHMSHMIFENSLLSKNIFNRPYAPSSKGGFKSEETEEFFCCQNKYCISSYSFRGNYSFLNLEIQKSQYIRPKVTVHKCAETIQGRKLFKGGNYMRKYGIYKSTFIFLLIFLVAP